ncbi:MAG: hypothetical protein NTU61_01820 [Candidatus Altiarchaeota archaeon]|nr:hypothetical protein [Candidatus Altiarchaeota archaeon]
MQNKKELGLKEYLITIVGIILLFWLVDGFQYLQGINLSDGGLFSTPQVAPSNNFVVVTPVGLGELTFEGAFKAEFINSAADPATVTAVSLNNLNSKGNCTVTTKFPITLNPGDRFNLNAGECAASGARVGKSYKIVAYITMTTTKKARMLAQTASWSKTPSGQSNASDFEQANSIPDGDSTVEFTSVGTFSGVYL